MRIHCSLHLRFQSIISCGLRFHKSTDMRLLISDLYNTLVVSPTVFEILTFRKWFVLPTPPGLPLFDAPAQGNPLEFRDEI